MARSKGIKMVLNDGTPYGLRTLALTNWSGAIAICPRTALKQLEKWNFVSSPALYMLFDRESLLHSMLDAESLYVGETDNLMQRLKTHASKRDDWDELIAFCSTDFTKTEVKYLEYYLLNKLQEDKKLHIQNKKKHTEPTIQSDTKDSLLDYLDTATDALISVGYNFMSPSDETRKELGQGQTVFLSMGTEEATATYSEMGVLVWEGSTVSEGVADSMSKGYKRLRDELTDEGKINTQVSPNHFVSDELFSSASAAASVILGYSVNGLTAWKTKEGKTLKEIEEESI